MDTTQSLKWIITNGVGQLAAGAGILILFVSGVPGFPTIPPGPIILGVSGIAVIALARRWPWVVVVGVLVSVFVLVGALVEGTALDRLAAPGEFGPFVGTGIQFVGLVVAVVAGLVALVNRRPSAGR